MILRACNAIMAVVTVAIALTAVPVNAQRVQQSASVDAQRNQGQGPPNALQGFSQNRDQPVKIRAASLEVREKEKLATFSGDVHLIQGDTELRCKSLVIFYEEEAGARPKGSEAGSGSKQFRKIEAKGGVTVVQKESQAAGDVASFDMRTNIVTLTGNVVVTRGTDVLRGQRLVVDLTTGVTKMDSGRVEGLFQRAPDRK